jgi:hypothetical protein
VEFNDPNQFNRRVIIHGSDICKPSEARLVGLVNSKTIGVPSLSGKPVTASRQTSCGQQSLGQYGNVRHWGADNDDQNSVLPTYRDIQPHRRPQYEVALDACIIRVKDKETAETVRISSFDKCKLVPPRLSPMPEWMFLFRQEG